MLFNIYSEQGDSFLVEANTPQAALDQFDRYVEEHKNEKEITFNSINSYSQNMIFLRPSA